AATALFDPRQSRWGREPVHVESHILIVDDDVQIRKLLGRYLAEQGFRVTLASDKRSLNVALESNDIKLIVLDVMLPDGSGLEICRDMRAENSHVPIILLTALKEDVDRIIGLEIGAERCRKPDAACRRSGARSAHSHDQDATSGRV